LTAFSRFFEQAAPRLDDFEPDPVVMVIPHSRTFAGRPKALDPTRRVVRILAEHLGIVPTAISELRLTAERLVTARLLLVPSPEILDEGALAMLRDAAARGVHVLVTGALGTTRPVAIREPTGWGATGDVPAWVTFDGGHADWLRCEDRPSLRVLEGRWWHEPLPLEHARETAPLLALLRAAAEAAGVATHPSDAPVAARVLLAPGVALVVAVNETPIDARRRVSVDGRTFEVPVLAGRSRLALVERTTGNVLASTDGEPIITTR
jgi:hypothetical protein